MRVGLVSAILILATFSGCFGDKGPTPSKTPDPPPAPVPDYHLDCAIAPGSKNPKWPEACLALASPNDSPSKTEVDLAVNPTNPLNIVVASKDKDPLASNSCVWAVAQVTKDGGKTWTTVYVGGDKAHRVPMSSGYECVTDPIMTFDSKGVFYYALQIYDHSPRGNVELPGACPVPDPASCTVPDTGSNFVLARSRDGGLTYEHYVLQAPGAGDILFHDYPRMITNPKTGSIHTIWNGYITAPTTGTVRPIVSSTRDGGETVDRPLILQPEGSDSVLAFFSGFAASKTGDIYVTMQKDENSDGGDPTNVWIWRSTDDARTFHEVGKAFQIHPAARQHGDHRYRTPSFVELSIDQAGNHSGRMHLFWTGWSPSTKSDVLTSHSDDGGVTWSTSVNVANLTAGDQAFVRPASGPDGRVHVLYTTQAYSGSELLDQELAWSDDGGATWENLRLTNVSYDGDKGIHQDDFPFIGDYNGLAVGPDNVVHAAWSHTGSGRAEIAYARIVPRAPTAATS